MPGLWERCVNSEPLLIPRRLAIQLLAHAQQLPAGEGIQGMVASQKNELLSLHFVAGSAGAIAKIPPGATAWAWVQPQSSRSPPDALPQGAARLLTVALDTKGVLQLRCWEPAAGKPVERNLKIQ